MCIGLLSMGTPIHAFIGLLAWLAVSVGVHAEDERLAGAREFFDRYRSLERNFDPELASLYAEDAVIWVTRIYSNDVVRQLKIPGDIYRLALRDSMDEAAEHGDFNEYSQIQFLPQAQGVQIQAQRYNLWRHYRSPYFALIRPDAEGEWRIAEERFETRVPHPATE